MKKRILSQALTWAACKARTPVVFGAMFAHLRVLQELQRSAPTQFTNDAPEAITIRTNQRIGLDQAGIRGMAEKSQ
jgi:hypothetical protein